MKTTETQLIAEIETNNNQGEVMETNETQVVAETTVETSEPATINPGEAPANEPVKEPVVVKPVVLYEPHSLAGLFPALSEKEMQQLTSDIIENGQKIPLTITEDGKLLDGVARQECIRRAGLTPNVIVLPKDHDPLKYVISVNMTRRHMSTDQLAISAALLQQQLAKISKSEKAKKAAAVRHGKVAPGSPSDPKLRSVEVAARTFNVPASKVKMATRLLQESPAAAEAVKSGKTSFKKANRDVWAAKNVAAIEQSAAEFNAETMGDFDKAVQLVHCDFRQLLEQRPDLRGSVDWIFTDIPYEFRDLHLVPELGKFAAEVLKPGAHLVIMTGTAGLPVVINGILQTPELAWRWQIAHTISGGGGIATMYGPYRINQYYKPILVIRKIGSDVLPSIISKDVVDAGPCSSLKGVHPHSQSPEGFENLMDVLDVRPNSLILDPFCGLSATGIAGIRKNCKFVACDIEDKYIGFSKKRLMAEWAKLHPQTVVVAEALKEAA